VKILNIGVTYIYIDRISSRGSINQSVSQSIYIYIDLTFSLRTKSVEKDEKTDNKQTS
jgi:hypothetical protein